VFNSGLLPVPGARWGLLRLLITVFVCSHD